MNGNQLVVKCPEGEEFDRLGELAAQAFNFSAERWQEFPDLVGRENLRVALAGEQTVGGMSFYPLGQWYGGKSIPMAGFALVLMSPEHRGHGYAFEMLTSVMQSLRDRFPIATLYASTQYLYRKAGFEQAGNNYRYCCSLKDIAGVKTLRPIRRIDPMQHRDTLQRLAEQYALSNNGYLDRNDGLFERMFGDSGSSAYTYAIGEEGGETGYVVYTQVRQSGRTSPSEQLWEQRTILVRDMVALDAETMETIWAFIAGNRSVTEMVHWTGPASDFRCLATSEYEPKVIRPQRWMLRMLNVRDALLKRGYPDIDAEIELEVTDTLLPDNEGTYRLTLRNGQPSIDRDARDRVARNNSIRLSVKDLAPLFTGLWTARQLQIAGRLECSESSTIELADRIFGGNEPWMPDAF